MKRITLQIILITGSISLAILSLHNLQNAYNTSSTLPCSYQNDTEEKSRPVCSNYLRRATGSLIASATLFLVVYAYPKLQIKQMNKP